MGRVVSHTELLEAVATDRKVGQSVALANGCFDLLHVGHLRYLAGAAAEADRLVVAINDDKSVTALKGKGPPVLPAAERAELVAAMEMVDYVVVFSTSTVSDLIRVLRPEVHCKGTDYTVETVPEREAVRRYGGRTAIVGDPKGHSTSELRARIVELDRRVSSS